MLLYFSSARVLRFAVGVEHSKNNKQNKIMGEIKEFYSLEDVAEMLGVNYQLIYKLVRTGDLTAARIGKVYRVSQADLTRYIDGSKSSQFEGVCVACNNVFQSRLSLKHTCPDCGEAICVDCWDRKKVRRCPTACLREPEVMTTQAPATLAAATVAENLAQETTESKKA